MPAVQSDADNQLKAMVAAIADTAESQTYNSHKPNTTALVKYLTASSIQTEVNGGSALSDLDLECMRQNVDTEYECKTGC